VTSRFVISLCDRTGKAVKPWLAAGFRCVLVDLQHPRGVTTDGLLTRIGASVFELHPYHRWMPQGNCYLAFAWPECTHFTYSGARWRRENGPTATAEGFRLFGACWDLLRYYEREHGSRWMLENPKGIPWSWCKPDHVFDPWQYGDLESKETGIWCGGGFQMPAPTVALKPHGVRQSVWMESPGPERANRRSVTPSGFARAVFGANATAHDIARVEATDAAIGDGASQ
jgi:hypothetical protein